VHVCTATGGRISAGFLESWSQFIHWTNDASTRERYQFHWRPFGGSDVYVARNGCLRNPWKGDQRDVGHIVPWMGYSEDYDRILWIDTDTIFDKKDVEQILSHDEDIVTGCVKVDLVNFGLQRQLETPYGGHAFATIRDTVKHPETGEMVDTFKVWIDEVQQPNGLCEVDMCGGAFLSVKKGVYEAMEYPWYRGGTAINRDGIVIELSEDLGWCIRAKEAGFKVWADPLVRPGHDKGGIILK
jgi:hypothetical protein